MKILNGKEQDYKNWYNNNSNPCGRACFDFAEKWAKLMEKEIERSEYSPIEVIDKRADNLSSTTGVKITTRFMYGAAVNILSQCWEYGKELKEWYDKNYKGACAKCLCGICPFRNDVQFPVFSNRGICEGKYKW